MSEAVRVYRFFGLSVSALRERLTDIWQLPAVRADMQAQGLDITLRLQADNAEWLMQVDEMVRESANVYLYSRDGSDLPTQVVRLLQQHHKTVAFAKSCTGGMIAAAVTGVPGASQVFGTGVVSYSGTCKEKLLHVRWDTLRRHGAVSAQTAGEMARGVRAASGASIGISVTGEAGPQPAEQPVGTVFIALADNKRTWVREWHLDTPDADRDSIRKAAAGHALDLARRYLQAYPAVMAGGHMAQEEEPRRTGFRRLPSLLPQRDDSRRRRVAKMVAWISALFILVGGIVGIYQYLSAPKNNRQLQDSLREMYHADMVVPEEDFRRYPGGMTAQFRNLYDINRNVAGWLRIGDTVIDYPVMLHSGGYYATHNFADELSYYGQPYVDAADYGTLMGDARVRIIYGNNTADNQMFSELLAYRRPAFLQQHSTVEFNTVFQNASYEIFAVMVADGNEDAVFRYAQTAFADDEAFEQYIAAIRARSLFDSDIEVTAADRLLLLSTNAQEEYSHTDTHFVIAARQVGTDKTAAITYRFNPDVRMPESWPSADNAPQTTTATTTTAAATTTTTAATTTTTTTAPTTTTVTTTQTTTTQTQATTAPSTEENGGGDTEMEEYDYTGD